METTQQPHSPLNPAQITLLRLLDRKISEQEVADIHQMLSNYFDSKLQAQVENDLASEQISNADFEALRNGEKVKEVANKRS